VSIETGQSGLDCQVLETLPDKQVLLGVIDLSTEEVESVETIKARVRRALDHIDAERILLAPDCGMKYLSRQAAFGKLANMAQAGSDLREELG
jgi:5-methyltetrahydropteroyltriglutamate--homocysteine methyltransferase